MNTIEEIKQEIKTVMIKSIEGELSEDNAARVIILLQTILIDELEKQNKAA